MAHLIPKAAIEKYSAAPAPTTITAARRLQEKIRNLLGAEYETFLQGSYKNDTVIRDMDDVDIVAIRRDHFSTMFSNPDPYRRRLFWNTIFLDVQKRISSDPKFRGRIQRRNKCIKVRGPLTADVVPAVTVITPEADPIAIWSWRKGAERLNSPRVHYDNNVGRHQRTSEYYKPTVRMLKNWTRNHFGEQSRVAPSFYLECLVYNAPDICFVPDGAERFAFVMAHIMSLSYESNVVRTIAGDKPIFVPSEWPKGQFTALYRRLLVSHAFVRRALDATTNIKALTFWKRVFRE